VERGDGGGVRQWGNKEGESGEGRGGERRREVGWG